MTINNLKSVIYRKLAGGVRFITRGRIPFLVVSVGQACTLKCKDCGNFSPYAEKENLAYACDKIISDLKLILKACTYIKVLQIQGGEPFIYPQLDRILHFLIDEKKVKNIQIATNGTIVPEKLFYLLRNKKIEVRISNYPVVDSIKICRLCEEFDKSNIKYSKYSFAGGSGEWTDCGSVGTPKETNDAIAADRFARCLFRGCLTLENGYIGKCSRCIHAAKVQGFTPKKGDYISVRESTNLKKELHRYREKSNTQNAFFMEACRYCYGSFYGKKIKPAVQLGKCLPD